MLIRKWDAEMGTELNASGHPSSTVELKLLIVARRFDEMFARTSKAFIPAFSPPPKRVLTDAKSRPKGGSFPKKSNNGSG